MDPHPDFAQTDLPRTVLLATCQLTPLSPAEVQEDYAAVMETAHHLSDGPGLWPDGLTLEDNAIDLAWHEREFTTKRSFSWIIRDVGGMYLGCFYIYPTIGARGTAKVVLWVRDHPDRRNLAATLKPALMDWTQKSLPPGVTTYWQCNPAS